MSPPFWPFKKKQPELETVPESKVISYGVSDESTAEKTLDDRSHLEDESYKLAMDKLGLIGGLDNRTDSVENSGPIESDNNEIETTTSVEIDEASITTDSDGEWVKNEQDGYWYRKMGDGNWDSQAYVQTESGEFIPYS
jgi:hypothetical protein